MSYPRFETVMSDQFPDYQWEAIEVTTSDSYILTMFHIYKEDALDDTKGPVFFQHGASMDGVEFVEWGGGQMTMMADLGHHVYVGNTRGTDYSRGHETLSAVDDQAEYWDFTWYDMAEDVLANVEAMYNHAGTGKGWYFGYSQGTIQMLVALTKYESELIQWLNSAVLLTPCTIAGTASEPDLSYASTVYVDIEREYGVYAKVGPTWEDDLDTLCTSFGWDNCAYYRNINANQQAMSFKTDAHWYQNTLTQRFQKFVEDWSYPDNFEADLIPIENISQMPISLFVGLFDFVCTKDKADELAENLSTVKNVHTFLKGHGFPLGNDDLYYERLLNELVAYDDEEEEDDGGEQPVDDEDDEQQDEDFATILKFGIT